MNLKNFEYLSKDVPFLRKDLIFRASFTVAFFAIFLIQLIAMLKNLIADNLNIGMAISSGVVLITCALFCFLSILYMLRSLRIISEVNNRGRCVSSVDILLNTKKDGFVKLYTFVCEFLALLATIVLACSLTYSILQVTYYDNISPYLPLIITICLTAYYAVFHLKNELQTVKTVNQYNSIY